MGRMEWSEGGGKWDNCNSIINKYSKKNSKKKKRSHGWKTHIVLDICKGEWVGEA